MAESLIKAKVWSDGTINNDELNKAITQLKYEKDAEHERNIENMIMEDAYKSPGKNKDASTVNDLAYHNLDEYKDEISDSIKQVEESKEPITDTYVCNTSDYLNIDSSSSDSSIHYERAHSVQARCTFCGGNNHSAENFFKSIRKEKEKGSRGWYFI